MVWLKKAWYFFLTDIKINGWLIYANSAQKHVTMEHYASWAKWRGIDRDKESEGCIGLFFRYTWAEFNLGSCFWAGKNPFVFSSSDFSYSRGIPSLINIDLGWVLFLKIWKHLSSVLCIGIDSKCPYTITAQISMIDDKCAFLQYRSLK